MESEFIVCGAERVSQNSQKSLSLQEKGGVFSSNNVVKQRVGSLKHFQPGLGSEETEAVN